MSKQNRDNKRAARDRLQVERERQARRDKVRRQLIAVIAVIVVIAVAAVVAIIIAKSGEKKPVVKPAHTTGKDGTLIVYGDPAVKDTLKIYEDPRCPFCGKFEAIDGKTVEKLAEDGKIKIEYHLATFLDGTLSTKGSKNALNAMGAALNEGMDKFIDYHNVLYANQPQETQSTFADNNELLKLADKVKGLKTPAFTKAVTKGTYNAWADSVNDAFSKSGVQGTPTVYLNSKKLNVINEQTGDAIAPAALEDQITKAIAK